MFEYLNFTLFLRFVRIEGLRGSRLVVRTSELKSFSIKRYNVMYKCLWISKTELSLVLGGVDQWVDQ